MHKISLPLTSAVPTSRGRTNQCVPKMKQPPCDAPTSPLTLSLLAASSSLEGGRPRQARQDRLGTGLPVAAGRGYAAAGEAMVAHRQLPPPHWLPQAPCTPASICAPVAARLTHNGLRSIPLHASRFLRQRCEQLGQAAARGAGCCDVPAPTEVQGCACPKIRNCLPDICTPVVCYLQHLSTPDYTLFLQAEELTTHAERSPWSGHRLPRECDSAWQGACGSTLPATCRAQHASSRAVLRS